MLFYEFIYLISFSFNNKFILNKIKPIENALDFSILILFNYLIFFNDYNSGDI